MEDAASHHPPGGSIKEEEPLLGALIGISRGGGGDFLNHVLNFVHDIT